MYCLLRIICKETQKGIILEIPKDKRVILEILLEVFREDQMAISVAVQTTIIIIILNTHRELMWKSFLICLISRMVNLNSQANRRRFWKFWGTSVTPKEEKLSMQLLKLSIRKKQINRKKVKINSKLDQNRYAKRKEKRRRKKRI